MDDMFMPEVEDIVVDDEAAEIEAATRELLSSERSSAIDDIAEITDEDVEHYTLDEDELYDSEDEALDAEETDHVLYPVVTYDIVDDEDYDDIEEYYD